MIFAVVVDLFSYEVTEYQAKIGFWIELIIARVPHATILIVPTHLDKMINENDVIKKCSDIIEMANSHVMRCKNEARKKSGVYEDDDDSNDENDNGDLINPILPKSLKFSKLVGVSQVEVFLWLIL